jgi:hypothetical protein
MTAVRCQHHRRLMVPRLAHGCIIVGCSYPKPASYAARLRARLAFWHTRPARLRPVVSGGRLHFSATEQLVVQFPVLWSLAA